MERMEKFYVTTPIYYVNDVPHIGHAYTTLAADIIARFYRGIMGSENVFFLTGTDEHGANIAQAAEAHGKSPKEYADEVSPRFKEAWEILNIKYDFFIRTTDPRHEKIASEIIQKIYDRGFIYKGLYEGWYCLGCERFLTEIEMVDGKCPLHTTKDPVYQKEKNYFFKLKDLSKKVLEKIESQEYKILPLERYNEIVSRLKIGVEDISISRAGVSWGIPVPWDKTQTIYVWVEALLNYYTTIKFLDDKEIFWPPSLQLMAKDILWFHCVIWQAILIAADISLPKTIFAHGFFTLDGTKMSKSLGNVISPKQLTDKYGTDGARYLLMSQYTFGSDGDISVGKFSEKYNSDLANGLGNHVARILGLCQKYTNGKIPEIREDPDQHPLRVAVDRLTWKNSWHERDRLLKEFKIQESLQSIWSYLKEADNYINSVKPWELHEVGEIEKLNYALYGLLDSLLQVAWQIYPFLPETAEKIAEALGEEKLKSANPLDKESYTNVKSGTVLKTDLRLFPRI